MQQRPHQNPQCARKRLTAMTPGELAAWLADHQGELEDFASYVQVYTKYRTRRGTRTATDERYERFLSQAADLIAGLAELREDAERDARVKE